MIDLTSKHPLFDRIHWVRRATSVASKLLSRIQILPNLIQATDKHRVHISRAKHDLAPGLYRVTVCTKSRVTLEGPEPNLEYPDVTAIWPTAAGVTVMLSGCTIPVALARIIRALPDDYAIDYALVDDMMRDQKFFAAVVSDNTVVFTNTSGDQSGLIATIKPYKVGE